MRVCFTSKSEVEIFSSAVMNSGAERKSPVSSRPASRPRSDVQARIAASLNESRSVSDRSAPLVAAASLNDKPDVAWSERTTAVLVASARLDYLD